MVGVLLLSLLGCPAEMLGVELPKGGEEALRWEDLSRDVSELAGFGDRSAPGQAREQGHRFIEQRLGQMKLLPAFDQSYRQQTGAGPLICGVKRGAQARSVAVLALDTGRGAAQGASPVAMLISLAKAYDLSTPPANSLLFCVVPAQGGLEAFAAASPLPDAALAAGLALGPVAGATLTPTAGKLTASADLILLTTGPEPQHGGADDLAGRMDYRQLLKNTRRALKALEDLQR